MMGDNGVLAIIPARGGSKSIPNKNIVPLLGKPLIVYTIETALQCREINRIVVSTDSPEIAAVAERAGVKVPALRPAELARDATRSVDVVRHVLDSNASGRWETALLLQPTAPLRNVEDIENCLRILRSHEELDAVVSVSAVVEPHPYKAKKIENGLLLPFVSGTSSEISRQQLPTAYRLNGAIYATRVSAILRADSLFGEKCAPYIMPEERSVNIDSRLDIMVAEALITEQANPQAGRGRE